MGAAIALVGGPDTARRALAVTLVGRGFQWVTEDLLLVRVASGHVEMRGLPGLLRLGPAAMLAYPALRAMLTEEEQTRYAGQTWRDLREIEARYDIDTADAFGPAGIAAGGALRMIVALRWRGRRDRRPARYRAARPRRCLRGARRRDALVRALRSAPGACRRTSTASSGSPRRSRCTPSPGRWTFRRSRTPSPPTRRRQPRETAPPPPTGHIDRCRNAPPCSMSARTPSACSSPIARTAR